MATVIFAMTTDGIRFFTTDGAINAHQYKRRYRIYHRVKIYVLLFVNKSRLLSGHVVMLALQREW
jgi:hypothetical protein